MTDEDLIAAARDAAKQSYSPYSVFPVGAALRFADGTVVTGTNIENAAGSRRSRSPDRAPSRLRRAAVAARCSTNSPRSAGPIPKSSASAPTTCVAPR